MFPGRLSQEALDWRICTVGENRGFAAVQVALPAALLFLYGHSQQFQQFQTATISANNAKFPYLEKEKYEIWAMKMEYWIQNADHNLWRIVQQGNSPKRLGKDAKGNTIVHPPVSLDEHVAVQRENKVRTLLLQALPEDHMPDFHHYDDARDIWLAVKASKKACIRVDDRFQKILSQVDSSAAQGQTMDDSTCKFLRALPSSMIMELDVRIGHSYSVKAAVAPTHSAFIGTASSGSKPTYSDQQRIVPSVSQTSGRSDNIMECVLHSFVAENEQDQDMIYEEFDQARYSAFRSQKLRRRTKPWSSLIPMVNWSESCGKKQDCFYDGDFFPKAQNEKKEWEVKYEATLARFDKWWMVSSRLENDKSSDSETYASYSVPCKSKAASVPAGSRNSSASVTADGSDPAASRKQTSVNSVIGPHPAGYWLKDQQTVSVGDLVQILNKYSCSGCSRKYQDRTIRTSKLDFENVYYVEELQHFNLFFVSQICDKKNKVLFTDTDCLVLSEEFQLPDAHQVVTRNSHTAGPSSSNGPSVMERNADYAEELAKLQRQEYEAKDAAARYGYLFSQATAEILCQAEAEIRNQGVSAVKDPAGIDSAVREPAGIVSADGVSTGSPSADSDPAGSNPADCFPPAGSVEPADESNPAVSSSVSADFNPVYADESTLPPGQQLGS
ncbi:hypothetical protein Tco_0731413, partial [Tanacetum coccineum]